MSPELEAKITELLDSRIADAKDLEGDARNYVRMIITHLSRINSTLSAIDRNLTLLEMKK